MSINRYLDGPFAPVTEEVTAFDLPSTGTVPRELAGRYLRIGPNPVRVHEPAAYQWTMGAGMVHGVRLRDGRAEWYRNRWVRSPSVSAQLGEEPKVVGGSPWGFAPNVQVVEHSGHTIALVEGGPPPYAMTYELDTVGESDLGRTPAGFCANAHSKVDRSTGELHSVAIQFGVEYVQHIVTDRGGVVRRAVDIPVPGNPNMHDFALTDNHVVLFDTPFVFSVERLGKGQVPVEWDHDRPTRVGVLPRTGAVPTWIETAPCEVSHVLNAYEMGAEIVIDLIVAPAHADITDVFGVPRTLERWRVDTAAGIVHRTGIDDRPQDFPRMNGLREVRPHRYGYTAGTELYRGASVLAQRPEAAYRNALLKHDLERGRTETHEFGADAAVSEPVFVPCAAPKTEDDGYIMTFVHNPIRGAADLVILAAQDFDGEPVARIHLPGRVPLGFHGNWIPDE
ncbi:carotenoid oxygenase [Nocardia panacis]|uniref:Dioxygenase n=1 Tax=Nocardia panacis TaxID=2340916 RepID=A0A3A4KEB9_9NOCA|nr:carotenoid oxygenase family protein [Nocardia panacis]RJO73855.1 carotenoid oxygenase [Nocardia panacis]